MSQLLETVKQSARSGSERRVNDIGASRLPQVNLLPSDISAARGLKKLKVRLAVVVLLVIALVGVGYVLVAGTVTTAQEKLTTEQRRTSTLQNEQRKYAEVPVLLKRWNDTSQALYLASVGEVAWQPVIDAISSVTSKDVTLNQLVIESWDPLNGMPAPSDDVQLPVVSRIAFETITTERPATVEWLTGLEALPGFGDARIVSIEATGEGNDLRYESVLSVSVNLGAVEGRFLPKELN